MLDFLRPHWGRWLVCAGALGVTLVAMGPAAAQPDVDELARRHFESGAAYLEESDYENALKAFEKAFELSPRPEIQLNIATVHERTGKLAAAIVALDEYLRLAPEGEFAAKTKLRRENLQERLDAMPDGGAVAEDAGIDDAASKPEAAPPPPAADAGSKQKSLPEKAEAAEEGSNVPAYIALGLGGLAAGGAVLTGILASNEHSDAESSCSPNCSDDDLSTGRTFALTSTVLTGAAVVGVSIGLLLLFTGGSEDAEAEAQRPAGRKHGFWKPRVGLDVGPEGAGASARWTF